MTQPKKIGKYTRVRTRRGKAPVRIDRCLMPGKTKPVRCPDRLSLRTTVVAGLARVQPGFGLQALAAAAIAEGAGGEATRRRSSPSTRRRGPTCRWSRAERVPALRDPRKPKPKPEAEAEARVRKVVAAPKPAPRRHRSTPDRDGDARCPTATPRYVPPAPRYVRAGADARAHADPDAAGALGRASTPRGTPMSVVDSVRSSGMRGRAGLCRSRSSRRSSSSPGSAAGVLGGGAPAASRRPLAKPSPRRSSGAGAAAAAPGAAGRARRRSALAGFERALWLRNAAAKLRARGRAAARRLADAAAGRAAALEAPGARGRPAAAEHDGVALPVPSTDGVAALFYAAPTTNGDRDRRLPRRSRPSIPSGLAARSRPPSRCPARRRLELGQRAAFFSRAAGVVVRSLDAARETGACARSPRPTSPRRRRSPPTASLARTGPPRPTLGAAHQRRAASRDATVGALGATASAYSALASAARARIPQPYADAGSAVPAPSADSGARWRGPRRRSTRRAGGPRRPHRRRRSLRARPPRRRRARRAQHARRDAGEHAAARRPRRPRARQPPRRQHASRRRRQVQEHARGEAGADAGDQEARVHRQVGRQGGHRRREQARRDRDAAGHQLAGPT